MVEVDVSAAYVSRWDEVVRGNKNKIWIHMVKIKL